MQPVTQSRREEVQSVLEAAAAWAESQADVAGLALVGSWARDEATMASDVDLVVLTTDVPRYVKRHDWWSFLGGGTPVRTADWGTLTERRVRLASGLEVEFGIAAPEWAATDPPDPGTQAVVREGMTILNDPHGHLGRLATACGSA